MTLSEIPFQHLQFNLPESLFWFSSLTCAKLDTDDDCCVTLNWNKKNRMHLVSGGASSTTAELQPHSPQVHWCEHLSPIRAQMWHAGSGHMQAFHPSSLCSRWCCEYTSHDCWLWKRSDSHNPSQKIRPSSRSPDRARPSLHKTLIDLMDLCVVHTHSPNKQSSQELSPWRRRASERLNRKCWPDRFYCWVLRGGCPANKVSRSYSSTDFQRG